MSEATGAVTDQALDPAPPPTTVQKLLAELIGTFVLVLVGCGSVVLSTQALIRSGGDISLFATITTVGLSFGLAVTIMIYAVGRISGGHFNPAVTLGAAIGGRLAWREVGIYVGAQLAGAILGAAVLFVLAFGFSDFDAFENNLGANGWGENGGGYAWWAAIVIEIVLTALFVFVILAVTDTRNEHPAMAPLTIGLTLAVIHFVAIPADGTSVNPARSLGPALFSGTDALLQLPVFLFAPLVGAVLAGLLYPAVYGHAAGPVPGSGLHLRRPSGAVPGYGAPDAYQQQWNQQAYPQTGSQTGQGYQSGAAGGGWDAQPIIQDGWQWDPAAQQWIPAQQPGQAGQGWPSDPSGEQTQIRPDTQQ